jgi:hypothetical protein
MHTVARPQHWGMGESEHAREESHGAALGNRKV